MCLVIEDVFLEFAHQGALLGEVRLAQHLVVEIDLVPGLRTGRNFAKDRARQVWLYIHQRVRHAVAIGSCATSKSPLRIASKRAGGHHPLRDLEADLLHSSTSQVPTYL